MMPKKNIADAKENYPNYLKNDPILNQLAEIFNGKLGEMIVVTEELKAEAEKRKVNKIPPGYLDSGKEGDKPYGDFFYGIKFFNMPNNMKLQ